MEDLGLAVIPEAAYADYRYNVIFGAYKWDPQVEDESTVAGHVVLMSPALAQKLSRWAEQLSLETMAMEEALLRKLPLAARLGLPGGIRRALPRLAGYERDRHVRLMRFDFHPTTEGWAVSEVNSDVPGGFAEASVLPEIACAFFDGYGPGENLADGLLGAFSRKVGQGERIAFVHATAYSDDRQVMQFLSDHFRGHGMHTFFAAPDHIRWVQRRAVSVLAGCEGPVGGMVRFYPLEWLVNLPRAARWQGYYDGQTPACNHPIAILAQSKRLPLIWDALGVAHPAWSALLPETKDPKLVKPQPGWLYKPALGRVGEGISIKGGMPEKERLKIERTARRHPQYWVAQRQFDSKPLIAPDGVPYHLCAGVFTVDGKSAGFYGRISPYPHIDAKAKDIPILVRKEGIT